MNVTFQNIKTSLNIYDLQIYEFFTNFFLTEKKFVKFVIF